MIWTVYMQHVCLSSTSYGIYGFMHPPCFCPYEDLQIGPWTLLTRYGPFTSSSSPFSAFSSHRDLLLVFRPRPPLLSSSDHQLTSPNPNSIFGTTTPLIHRCLTLHLLRHRPLLPKPHLHRSPKFEYLMRSLLFAFLGKWARATGSHAIAPKIFCRSHPMICWWFPSGFLTAHIKRGEPVLLSSGPNN
jgi:hypothetical protein